jgi:hypothetical protein
MPETQRGKPGRRGRRRGPDKSWWPVFLENLTLGGTIKAACKAVGIDHCTYYQHLKKFPEFEQQVREASDHSRDFVVDPEIFRRAIIGVPRKRFTSDGKPIIDPETGKQYVEFMHSEKLLAMWAKARWPEIYGDKSEVKHVGTLRFHPITFDGDKEPVINEPD